MKSYILLILLLISGIISAQEDKLSFVKDEKVKKEIQRSLEYFNKTNTIPNKIKNSVIFITFEFEDLLEIENLGIYYSTYIPTQYAELSDKGQFKSDFQNERLYFNYSKNIILVFVMGSKYFDKEQMKQLSNQVQISKKDLMKSEFFKYEKGDEFNWDRVVNVISLDKLNDKFIPVRVNTFDLVTFMEIWYGVDAKEIPVSQTKYKGTNKKNSEYKFHTYPK
ncbi:MAG: hypothetical protein MUW56_21130 [Chryseobacterium sp.]|uniref:hypothetical protein n=1 Tax=Chryseobacterium sp. TaxID=1871047 RepID=UPI0025BCBC7D|nr:hypothetical protein [Chryseobacterium sp.]MCJ7936059.1 hypothetical protein [Chryseobacterium sp.]